MFIAEPQIIRNLPGFRFHCKLGTQTTFVKRFLRFASPLRSFSFPYTLLFSVFVSNLPEFLKLFPWYLGARRTHGFGLKNLPKVLSHGVNSKPGESRWFIPREKKTTHNRTNSQLTFSQFLQICEPQPWFIKGLNIFFERVLLNLLIFVEPKLDFLNSKRQNETWARNSFTKWSEMSLCEIKS